jgi:hypothetical protein
LDQSSGLRAIRKQLKGSMKGTSGASPSGHSSGSESGSATMSPASSDDLSTATTPEMHAPNTFISPKETSLHSPEVAPVPDMFNSPGVVNMPAKGQWQSSTTSTAAPQELMYSTMDPNALGIQSRDDLSVSGMVDLQHAWLPQMPPLTDAELASMNWDWAAHTGMKHDQDATVAPAAVWSDMDMVL